MGRRNPIHVIGDPMRQGVTWVSDELIRAGAHRHALGSDGLVVMAYLLSWASAPNSAKRAWETSAAQISEQFGWGGNRERAQRAIDAAIKDGRLLMRKYVRDGVELERRRAYVVCAGGRRFTAEEVLQWSAPIVLPSKAASTDGAI